ncbi:MAG TPA: hypothetical protein ENN17_00180 [bacterium]|nr:hypothetical protein [bacterium]
MNSIERAVYNALKRNPRMKNAVVDCYQRLFSRIPVRNRYFGNKISVREGFFFGFHDKCPWSADNRFLLAHHCGDAPLRMPQPDESVEVGYFSGEDHTRFQPIGTTLSWNWQMGSMLQWVGKTSDIIFNDVEGAQNVARIVTDQGDHVATLTRPVTAVSPDGKNALSYSFERLRIGAPGYEYANGQEAEAFDRIPQNDGLYRISINDQKIWKLFSVADIVELNPTSCMKDAYHFFSHCQFSPSGKRFVFYHRWLLSTGRLRSRMISSDLDGGRLYIFPTAGMVSHMCWRDDEDILAYANTNEFGDQYYLFKDNEDVFQVFGKGQFKTDGHPQFSNDGRYILTDTYPDRFRRQSLLVYDMERDLLTTVMQLRISLIYRYDVRCDFHPRWNRNSTMICFDSAHSGKRSLCTMPFQQPNQ